MKDLSCKFGDKCHFWHPKKLKKISHTTESKNEKPFIIEESPSYANVVRKSLQPQLNPNVPFLGVNPPVYQNVTGQVHQSQQPFVGQTNHTHHSFLDIQSKQKQLMELCMTLSQKVKNMYNMQM